MNVRFAVRPTILPRGGGPDGLAPVLINKGTGIGWSSYHLHRREDIYGQDACVYRPERWEGGRLSHEVAQTGGFLDFHAGPRVCLGSAYFSRSIFLLVTSLGFHGYTDMTLICFQKTTLLWKPAWLSFDCFRHIPLSASHQVCQMGPSGPRSRI